MRRAASLWMLCALAACRDETPALTARWFGATPAPPGELAALRIGMTLAELRAALPGAEPGELDAHGRAVVDVPTGRRELTAQVLLEARAVVTLVVNIDTRDCAQLLAQAWGAPRTGANAAGQPERFWLDERAHWKVRLDAGARCSLWFERHLPATAGFFGARAAPPPALARLLGMPLAEAHQVAPALVGPPGDTTGDLGVSDVRGFVVPDEAGARIAAVGLHVPFMAVPQLEQAWGPPTFLSGQHAWLDPQGGWLVRAPEQKLVDHDVLFERYIPGATLLAGGPTDLTAFTRTPLWGLTLAEVRRLHPTLVERERSQVHMQTVAEYELPPTEWADRGDVTRVALELGARGTVVGMAIELPYVPGWSARLAAAIEAKWGEGEAPAPGVTIYDQATSFSSFTVLIYGQ